MAMFSERFSRLWWFLLELTALLFITSLVNWYGGRNDHAPKTQHGTNMDFMTLDHKYDHLWHNPAVADGGYISLETRGPNGEELHGSISMFHQLHCLGSFRTALQKAHDGKKFGFDWRDDGHWPHCMFYLYQTILCHADDTIEMENTWHTANGSLSFIDGSRDWRTCGNSQKLYDLWGEKSAKKVGGVLDTAVGGPKCGWKDRECIYDD